MSEAKVILRFDDERDSIAVLSSVAQQALREMQPGQRWGFRRGDRYFYAIRTPHSLSVRAQPPSDPSPDAALKEIGG